MADVVDLANQLYAAEVDTVLKYRTHLPPTGYCYNCREKINSGLFCDADCGDDYYKRVNQSKHNIIPKR